MPFTSITKPIQGDATKKAFADAVIDDLNYLYNQLSGLTGLAVPNSSFEGDVDVDNVPDQWAKTLYSGGAFVITGTGLADTNVIHGRRAVKLTSPGGAGNGGGTLTTSDFIEVTPNRVLTVSWQMFSTIATIRNKVQILWYDGAQAAISTTDLYSSITNGLTWAPYWASAVAPATARYCKIRLIGAENTTTVAGSAYFDDVRVSQLTGQNTVRLDVAGTWYWALPAGVNVVFAEIIGGGGGGAGGDGANGGGGGGAGARCFAVITGAGTHTIIVGAGGAGGTASNNGVTGTASSIDGTFLAGGGIRGIISVLGNGGAGGAASGGFTNENGNAGANRSGGNGGNGGASPVGYFGLGGVGGGALGTAGALGGGGGGSNASGAGAAGAGGTGLVILRW